MTEKAVSNDRGRMHTMTEKNTQTNKTHFSLRFVENFLDFSPILGETRGKSAKHTATERFSQHLGEKKNRRWFSEENHLRWNTFI